MAVAGLHLGEIVAPARLRIQKNCADYRLEIAPNSASVVVEDSADPCYVSRTRIAGDQILDEVLRQEWPDVRMIEDILQGRIQIRLYVVARGQRGIKQCFCCGVVVTGEWNHRTAIEQWIVKLRSRARRRRISPAGKHIRKT